ncbi:MarR family winged helix-turn-helix transcriptional regulator [Yinghuangia sp. YIM S09857]|uniref:MarR family winged helix-turn-helix transcriptional regulator n=1 Tax=Yinghuangia sp. YIM S09857 TaxID=3436929 RepID=UPI003F529926
MGQERVDRERARLLDELQAAVESVMTATRSGERHRALAGRAGQDLTRGEAQTLARIVKHGPLRVSGLAEMLDADRSLASRQVEALVRAGLAERVPDPTDGRATLVSATLRGKRLTTAIRRQWAQAMGEAVTDWPTADVELLTGLLQSFGSSLLGAMESTAHEANHDEDK